MERNSAVEKFMNPKDEGCHCHTRNFLYQSNKTLDFLHLVVPINIYCFKRHPDIYFKRSAEFISKISTSSGCGLRFQKSIKINLLKVRLEKKLHISGKIIRLVLRRNHKLVFLQLDIEQIERFTMGGYSNFIRSCKDKQVYIIKLEAFNCRDMIMWFY